MLIIVRSATKRYYIPDHTLYTNYACSTILFDMLFQICMWYVLIFQVDTVKRMCIKKLPPILAIQLKRFDYDWERYGIIALSVKHTHAYNNQVLLIFTGRTYLVSGNVQSNLMITLNFQEKSIWVHIPCMD